MADNALDAGDVCAGIEAELKRVVQQTKLLERYFNVTSRSLESLLRILTDTFPALVDLIKAQNDKKWSALSEMVNELLMVKDALSDEHFDSFVAALQSSLQTEELRHLFGLIKPLSVVISTKPNAPMGFISDTLIKLLRNCINN